MKYFSLFTGIGGFELGIQQAYEETNRIQGNRSSRPKCGGSSSDLPNRCQMSTIEKPSCVGYSEIDKYAIQIFERHFPRIKNHGDCTKIVASELPDFDLLIGGFPCQSFSIAGKRLGFNDTRGTLFFDIARIAEEKRPKYLLLENVKGLLSHDNGRTFKTIITTLAELGYDLQWQVLNSKNFGVPQNRERVFIVGHLRGEPRPKVFPIGETNKDVGKEIKIVAHRKNYRRNMQIFDITGSTEALDTSGGGGRQRHIVAPNKKEIDLSEVPNRLFQLTEVRTEKGKQTRREIRQKENRDSTKRGKDDKKYIPLKEDIGNCITTGKESIEKWLIEKTRIRRLTPTECERLQGFPDNWTEGVSDTQRYKTLGNAVTVNVVREIMKAFFRANQ